MSSQGAELPSVTRIPAAARKVSGAVRIWASTLPAKKASGGHTTSTRSPLTRV